MCRELFPLDWIEFERAIKSLVRQLKDIELQGVYGVPRGGLVLAVRLSHELGIPLLDKPIKGALWVDDIIETGKTLGKAPTGMLYACWVNKGDFPAITALHFDYPHWIVFPWENLLKAEQDRNEYVESRAKSNITSE